MTTVLQHQAHGVTTVWQRQKHCNNKHKQMPRHGHNTVTAWQRPGKGTAGHGRWRGARKRAHAKRLQRMEGTRGEEARMHSAQNITRDAIDLKPIPRNKSGSAKAT